MKVATVLVLGLCCPALALSIGTTSSIRVPSKVPRWGTHAVLDLRGGDQQDYLAIDEVEPGDITQDHDVILDKSEKVQHSTLSLSSLAPMTSALAALGAAYGASLEKRPIATKSITAGFIFALSDWLAQRLEKSPEKRTDWTRALSSGLVGLLYFGPAAHFWYDTIFRILPGTSLVSTMQKAALGQIFFGPSFTCIFFATSLLQQGNFSLGSWWRKIRSDLPGAWAAGLGFWPLVDLVSYSMIPKEWIPLFVNTCSLVWTIYLSLIANRQSRPSPP